MNGIKVGDNTYKIGRLSAFEQLHLTSKLSQPLIVVSNMQNKEEMDARKFAQAFIVSSSGMSDQDRQTVISRALSCVQRQSASLWANVVEPTTGRLMFEDMTVMDLAELTWHVLVAHRIPDFFVIPPSVSTGDQVPPSS